jgi:hypothetical protein
LSAALLVGALLGTGCASLTETLDPLGRRSDLEDAQRRYTQFVRWGEANAASAFVSDASRKDFFARSSRLAQTRFTDYEQGPLEFAKDGKSATVVVTYSGYKISSLVDRPMRETQRWKFDGDAGGWRVDPDWSELQASLAPERR